MNNIKKNYAVRGNFSKTFMTKLDCFKNIVELTKDSNNSLDLQYRGDCINVYYKGGSLLCLSGKCSVNFDEKYFLNKSKDGFCSSDIEKLRKGDYMEELNHSKKYKNSTEEEREEARVKALKVHDQLVEKRNSAVKRLKESKTLEDTKTALLYMMKQIDEWKRENNQTKNERSIQHNISMLNKKLDSQTDLLVIDIEYAISANANYSIEGVNNGNQPRMDIIAIDKSGQLYVMELKYGMKSVDLKKSGAESHKVDFIKSVGDPKKWPYFMEDIKILFEAKKKDGVIDENIILNTENPPCFAFIMKCSKPSDEEEFKKHLVEKGIADTMTLYLPIDEDDSFKEEYYKLNQKYIG